MWDEHRLIAGLDDWRGERLAEVREAIRDALPDVSTTGVRHRALRARPARLQALLTTRLAQRTQDAGRRS